MTARYPPGPRDRVFGLSYLAHFRRHPLDFTMDVARRYGDLAFARVGWFHVYFVNRPELVREVLTSKLKSFRKLSRQMKALRAIEGNGPVVAEGDDWRRQRPMVQPAFHASHFERYASLVVEHTRRRIEHWSSGVPLDITDEMNQLALEVIARLIFDVDWSDRAAMLRSAVATFRDYMQKEISSLVRLPDWLPLPGKLRQRRAVRAMDRLIWELIRERRSSSTPHKDMLAIMLSAAPGAGQAPITDREARDDAATLFVAGHDTSSAALAWLWYVLARHPHVEQRVRDEIDTVLGGRPATWADVPRLAYTEMVVKESMRLYPPSAFLFGREAVEDVDLGGYRLRRGSWVIISPYVMQHDPRNFPNPDVFDPERFAPGRVEDIPSYAYLPFGGGPRICIGSALAIMEIVVVAATVLQRYVLRMDPNQPALEPEIKVIFRPRGPLPMRPIARTSETAALAHEAVP